MHVYSFLRELADSWVLLGMFVLFVVAIVFLWRPGARRQQREAAESIFRNERRPAPADEDEVE